LQAKHVSLFATGGQLFAWFLLFLLMTHDSLFIKVGMLSLGVFAFVLPGNPETGEKWVRYCHLVLEM